MRPNFFQKSGHGHLPLLFVMRKVIGANSISSNELAKSGCGAGAGVHFSLGALSATLWRHALPRHQGLVLVTWRPWYVGVCVGQAGNPGPESAAATQREQKLVQKIGVVDWNVGYHRGPHVFKRPVCC